MQLRCILFQCFPHTNDDRLLTISFVFYDYMTGRRFLTLINLSFFRLLSVRPSQDPLVFFLWPQSILFPMCPVILVLGPLKLNAWGSLHCMYRHFHWIHSSNNFFFRLYILKIPILSLQDDGTVKSKFRCESKPDS